MLVNVRTPSGTWPLRLPGVIRKLKYPLMIAERMKVFHSDGIARGSNRRELDTAYLDDGHG